MALVLALGTLGVGYAMWSDTINITGSVGTGSVDLDVQSVSCTWVYKVIDLGYEDYVVGDIVVSSTQLDLDQDGVADDPPKNELLEVASAVTASGLADTDTATMTFTNLFPTYTPIAADVVLHYNGTIPAHVIYSENFTGLGALGACQLDMWELSTDGGSSWSEVADPGTLQLHYCNLLRYTKWFALPESPAGDALQGILNANFTISIKAQQWNE